MIASSESVYTPTFDDLFDYVHECLVTEAGFDPNDDDFDVMATINACSGNLEFAEQFCLETDTDFDAVRAILGDAGAGCDCEILCNATEQLNEEQELPRMW